MTRLRSTFVILIAAAAGMAALLAFLPAAGHDQLWCLYVARHVLDGTRLYGPELLESNPPLIIWLSMLPVTLAHLIHVPAPALGKALVVVLEAAIAAVSLRQIRRLSLSATQIAALAFAFVTIFNVIPARDLGQRDHLLALLCLPYLPAAANRLAAVNHTKISSFQPAPKKTFSSRLERSGVERPASSPIASTAFENTLIGLAVGLGLALKPQQAILFIAIELYLILRSRSLRSLLRPEPFALLAAAIVYIAAIQKLTPAYLTTVLPILRDTYWAVGSLGFLQLIWQGIELHILAVTALLLWFKQRADPQPSNPETSFLNRTFVPILLVAGTASTLAYYVQGTGWYYQQLPAISFFAFALVFESLPLLDRKVPGWLPKAACALAVLALALTTHFMNYPFTEARSFAIDTPDPTFFERLAPRTAVATLTTTVDYTVMPAARYDLTIAQRYPHLWMLPAILRSEQPAPGSEPLHPIPPARLAELDRMQHHFMLQDLQRWQPQLVLVERCQHADVHCQLLEDRNDDLLAWFLRDPAFAAEWRNYTYTSSRGPFDAYTRVSSVAAPIQ